MAFDGGKPVKNLVWNSTTKKWEEMQMYRVNGNGELVVDTSILATSAKQDTLLAELQLKADLTETQPVSFPSSNQSAFGTLETSEKTPVFQGDFVYGLNTQSWQYVYVFTVTDPATDPVAGDQYSNSNQTFTVIYHLTTTLVCYGTGNPAASGNLARVTGTGTNPIVYSAFTTQAGVTSGTGATIDTNAARLRIQSGTASAGYAYIQSRRPIRYRAGQGMITRFTPLFTAGVANNIQLWGMGLIVSNVPYDGYFFGYNGTSFGIVHYVRGTPAWTAQASWNGGTLPFTWNPAFGTPVMIKYPYLGFGDIFFYVQNPSSGAWILAHTIRYANTVATTQISNPTLHFMGFTLNSGNTTNQIMYCGSVGMFISGERSFISNPKWAQAATLGAVTTEANLLSIKNAITYNGVTNTGLIRVTSLSYASSAANGNAIFRFKRGATLGGTPSYAAISGTTNDQGATITAGNSIASFDIAGTTITGGRLDFNVVLDNPDAGYVDLIDHNIIIAPGEILTISGFSTIGSVMAVGINWSEDI